MGVSSSTNNKESNQSNGNHFQSIIQSNRNSNFNKSPSNAITNSEDKKNVVELDKRAKVIKRIDYRLLWDNFLSENYENFAISTSQLKPLLYLSMDRSVEDNDKRKYSDEAFKSDIDSYVELLVDLNGRGETIDFISVLSSAIILNYQPIESKIDVLYFYITFETNEDSTLQFNEFYLAIKSFENGVSNCLGHVASSEDYLRIVASQWLALADPNHKGSADRNTNISKKNFFDFCINRQHVVRRLLEALGQAGTMYELTSDVSSEESIYNSSNILEKAPSGGDEWMANPPWKKVAERMRPSTAKNNNSPPSSSISLSWVHGYRGFDCRNNVFSVSVDGSHILYHTAALVICQYSGSSDRKQSYFNMHTDDIVAMAIASHPNDSAKRVVASGQIGKTPTIYVSMLCLDKDTHFDSLVCCKGYHTKGVAQLAFSGDSKRLLSIGVEYTVAVYNTDVSASPQDLGRMVFSSQGPKDKILHCCFAGNQMKSFISCGEKHVIFWSNNSSSYSQIIGKLGSEKSKLFLTAVNINDTAVAVGTADGDIYICKVSESKDCVLLPSVKNCLAIHAKGVTCLSVDSSRTILLSGGKDGKANVWRINSEDGVSLLSLLCSVYTDTCSLRSICLSGDGNALIISNINCDIKLISMIDKSTFKSLTSSQPVQSQVSTLVSAHCKEELWGLCIVPKSYKFITVGDDGYLKVWDISTNCLLESFDLQLPARCCAVSPDAVYLAVGFNAKTGKGKAKQSQGVVMIFRLESLLQVQSSNQAKLASSLVLEIKEAKQSISCIKFSPNGTILTVGSRDNSIYHYSVVQQFKFKSKFSKHNSGVLGFDFSSCGKYLVSYCSAYELLYSEVNTGAHITKAESLLKEIDWETCTCSLGWSVTGLWRGGMDGSDINSVDRSPCRQLVVSGEDSGKLCMFRYPAMTEGGSQHIEYSGHSSHITNVRWLSINDSQFLISCGGNDKSVFVWSCDSYQGDSYDKSSKLSKSEVKSNSFDAEESFDLPGGGDEFLAVKPWLGAIVPPTYWSNPDPTKLPPYSAALSEVCSLQKKLDQLNVNDDYYVPLYETLRQSTLLANQKMSEACTADSCTQPPSDDLELDWVYGYRGYDSRNNSYFLSIDSELMVVYPAAGLIVITNYQKLTQRYFRGHTDDVLCLAYCQDTSSNHLVASGQVGKGNTYVWDPTTIKILSTLNTKQKTVILLSFSNDGKFLVTVAEDKSIAVSDWKAGNVLTNTQGEASLSHHLIAIYNNLSGVISFVNTGDKFIKIWTINGRNITGTKVSISPLSKPQAFLCGVSVGNKIVIGAEDGYLYVSADNGKSLQGKWPHLINSTSKELAELSASKSKSAAVTAITYNSNLGLLVSGCRNGSVCLWNCLRNNFDSFDFDPKDKTRKLELSAADVYNFFRLDDVSGLKDAVCKQVHNLSIKAGLGSDDVLVLIGTKGCDLFIVQCSKGSSSQVSLFSYQSNKQSTGFLTRCHYADELWGLTTHPVKPEFITVGDDKTMRMFSLKSKKQLAICNLGLMARCCIYHPINSSIVAVGFGGRVGRGKESGGGIVRVYKFSEQDNSIEFVKLAEKSDSKQWISDIKFSGDGRVLVASAHDCKIYIYDVYLDSAMSRADLKLRHVFAKHNSVVNHIDLSFDGAFMQSNCSAYELLFCDISSGKQITSATELKDVRWSDWTCPLGWPVQGIWSGNMDGSDINSVDRSHTGHLLAVGDDFGAVSLYRYPCPKTGAGKNTYQGHSSHVMNVRWSVGDEYLISCGGGDKCIFQWKHVISETSQENKQDNNTEIIENNQSEFSEPSGGDESGAIKPWLGAIKPPKFPPPINKSAPLIKLNLEWVYGYCSSAVAGSGGNKLKVSNNLFYNTNGQLVYPAASLGIIQESMSIHGKRSQIYFQGHDDDVLCLSVSHNRRFAVTGQTASKSSKGKGSVIVWDAVDGRVLTRMDGCHQRGVAVVCFNDDDSQLLSIGLDDTNTHILWSDSQGNWSRADKVAEEKGDKGTVLFSRFIHSKNTLRQKGDSLFVSGGSGSINFWRLEGAKLSKKQGKWGKAKSPSAVLCCGNIMSKDMKYRLVVGTSSGELLVFEDNKEVINIVDKAHSGPVVSISEGITSGDISFLITGGKDHYVKVWNQSLQLISSFDVTKYSLIDGAITSVDYWTDSTSNNVRCIAIGTSGGEILQLDLSNNDSKSLNISDASATVEMHSHSSGELWGVSPHPIDPNIVATVGDEGTLRIWSTGSTDESFELLGHLCLGWAARSLAWHPSGTLIAVGFMESVKGGVLSKKKDGKSKAGGKEVSPTHSGAVHLFSVAINGKDVSLIKVSEGCSSAAWIQELRFSPDGSLLAVCSHDKHMYVYAIPSLSAEELKSCLLKPKFDFNKHSSAVLHIDFSSDGLYFQTNCQAGELLFGNAETGRQETSATKLANYNNNPENEEDSEQGYWITQTCKLGWSVQGIFGSNIDLSDINSVDRHHNFKVIATADDFGLVKVFRYPCIETTSEFIVGKGHSSHVTNVRWTSGDQLVSVGGNDKCLFVWKMLNM
eukprot:CAMPEP_0196761886 /NCGR_PEP_ID=MMETSP1095-20130614/1198_1 /TAXON_ID=96789 ORGANISM="Chromulina nebulosa, Strain UTEXLB2642" /NCGR_SAMPLE_ID=MMETSP1095 /ASSEMBLY_ACC=CAM_ASM_000446 /LENGTH=2526 /DNA_ID=CAMNT_0042111955 /DNA_START=12 /DNA_END=7592 /DNA_ORIENTATION=-